LYAVFESWILEAALCTGVTTSGTHTPKCPAQRERAAWFDDECRKKRRADIARCCDEKGGSTHTWPASERV